MAIHTAVFRHQTTVLSAGDFNQIEAVNDGLFLITGGRLVLPADMWLVASFAQSPNISAARVSSASLRRISPAHIVPVNPPATQFEPSIMVYPTSPLRLPAQEEISVEVLTAAPDTDLFSILWVADGRTPAPAGDSFWIRYTSSTATTPGQWTTLNVLYDTPLAAGVYAVIGIQHTCPGGTGLCSRLIFDGQTLRPGVLPITGTTTMRSNWVFYDGSLGVLGTFRSYSPPRVEVLASGVENAHQGYLRVVRISDVDFAAPGAAAGPARTYG